MFQFIEASGLPKTRANARRLAAPVLNRVRTRVRNADADHRGGVPFKQRRSDGAEAQASEASRDRVPRTSAQAGRTECPAAMNLEAAIQGPNEAPDGQLQEQGQRAAVKQHRRTPAEDGSCPGDDYAGTPAFKQPERGRRGAGFQCVL